MPGALCLQGGGEFSSDCLPMDAELLRRAGPGPVVVSALAGSVGRDYGTATANGVRHFSSLGASDVVAAPDARTDRAGALAALGSAALVVLPGGSPRRLHDALSATGAGAVIAERFAAGALVLGASAGAMVLCGWLVDPEGRGPGLSLLPGLGLAPELLVVPHWNGSRGRTRWLDAAGAAPVPVTVLGLPEASGVLVEGRICTALGRSATRLVAEGRDLTPMQTWSLT